MESTEIAQSLRLSAISKWGCTQPETPHTVREGGGGCTEPETVGKFHHGGCKKLETPRNFGERSAPKKNSKPETVGNSIMGVQKA